MSDTNTQYLSQDSKQGISEDDDIARQPNTQFLLLKKLTHDRVNIFLDLVLKKEKVNDNDIHDHIEGIMTSFFNAIEIRNPTTTNTIAQTIKLIVSKYAAEDSPEAELKPEDSLQEDDIISLIKVKDTRQFTPYGYHENPDPDIVLVESIHTTNPLETVLNQQAKIKKKRSSIIPSAIRSQNRRTQPKPSLFASSQSTQSLSVDVVVNSSSHSSVPSIHPEPLKEQDDPSEDMEMVDDQSIPSTRQSNTRVPKEIFDKPTISNYKPSDEHKIQFKEIFSLFSSVSSTSNDSIDNVSIEMCDHSIMCQIISKWRQLPYQSIVFPNWIANFANITEMLFKYYEECDDDPTQLRIRHFILNFLKNINYFKNLEDRLMDIKTALDYQSFQFKNVNLEALSAYESSDYSDIPIEDIYPWYNFFERVTFNYNKLRRDFDSILNIINEFGEKTYDAFDSNFKKLVEDRTFSTDSIIIGSPPVKVDIFDDNWMSIFGLQNVLFNNFLRYIPLYGYFLNDVYNFPFDDDIARDYYNITIGSEEKINPYPTIGYSLNYNPLTSDIITFLLEKKWSDSTAAIFSNSSSQALTLMPSNSSGSLPYAASNTSTYSTRRRTAASTLQLDIPSPSPHSTPMGSRRKRIASSRDDDFDEDDEDHKKKIRGAALAPPNNGRYAGPLHIESRHTMGDEMPETLIIKYYSILLKHVLFDEPCKSVTPVGTGYNDVIFEIVHNDTVSMYIPPIRYNYNRINPVILNPALSSDSLYKLLVRISEPPSSPQKITNGRVLMNITQHFLLARFDMDTLIDDPTMNEARCVEISSTVKSMYCQHSNQGQIAVSHITSYGGFDAFVFEFLTTEYLLDIFLKSLILAYGNHDGKVRHDRIVADAGKQLECRYISTYTDTYNNNLVKKLEQYSGTSPSSSQSELYPSSSSSSSSISPMGSSRAVRTSRIRQNDELLMSSSESREDLPINTTSSVFSSNMPEMVSPSAIAAAGNRVGIATAIGEGRIPNTPVNTPANSLEASSPLVDNSVVFENTIGMMSDEDPLPEFDIVEPPIILHADPNANNFE